MTVWIIVVIIVIIVRFRIQSFTLENAVARAYSDVFVFWGHRLGFRRYS